MAFYVISDTPELESTTIRQNTVAFKDAKMSEYAPNSMGVIQFNEFDVNYTIDQGRINYYVETISIPYETGIDNGNGYFTMMGKTAWTANLFFPNWWRYVIKRSNQSPPSPIKTHSVNVPLITSAQIVPPQEPSGTHTIEIVPLSAPYEPNSPVPGGSYFYIDYGGEVTSYIMFETQLANVSNSKGPSYSQYYIKKIYELQNVDITTWNNVPYTIKVYGDIEPYENHPQIGVGDPEYQTIYSSSNPIVKSNLFDGVMNLRGPYNATNVNGTTEGLISIKEWEINNGYFKVFNSSFFRGKINDSYFSFNWPVVQGQTIARIGTYPDPSYLPFANQTSEYRGEPVNRYSFGGSYLDKWSTDGEGKLTITPKTYNPIRTVTGFWLYTNDTLSFWKDNTSSVKTGSIIYKGVNEQNNDEMSSPLLSGDAAYQEFDYLIGVLDKKVRVFNTNDIGNITIYNNVWPVKVDNYLQEPYIFVPKNQNTLQTLLTSNTTIVYVSPTLNETLTAINGTGVILGGATSPLSEQPYPFTIINGTFTNFTQVPNSNYYTSSSSGLKIGNTLYNDIPEPVLNQIGVQNITSSIAIRWTTGNTGIINYAAQVYETTLAQAQIPDVFYANSFTPLSVTQLFDQYGNIITSQDPQSNVTEIDSNYYRWEIGANGLIAPIVQLYAVTTLLINDAYYADSSQIPNIKKLYGQDGTLLTAPENNVTIGLIRYDANTEYRYEITDLGAVTTKRIFQVAWNIESSLYADNSVITAATKLYTNDGTLVVATGEPLVGIVSVGIYKYRYEINSQGEFSTVAVFGPMADTNDASITYYYTSLPPSGNSYVYNEIGAPYSGPGSYTENNGEQALIHSWVADSNGLITSVTTITPPTSEDPPPSP